jgi:hypothetical protein
LAADAGRDHAVSSTIAPDTLAARLRRWRRHFTGPGDLITFLVIGTALLRAPHLLARGGLPRTLAQLDARPRLARGIRSDDAASIARAQRLALYADVWLRRLRLANPCLRRTLVLFGRLRRAGLPVRFCLGVRAGPALSADDPLDGHAWLELHGQPFLERSPLPAQHVTTFRYPEDARRMASGR